MTEQGHYHVRRGLSRSWKCRVGAFLSIDIYCWYIVFYIFHFPFSNYKYNKYRPLTNIWL